ncbi:MAG: S1 RNA-binding domain-containing protein [Candidatus Moranbacteria bacterium]|nr:S1 RNA-binding domain-containing protein [Candidatus Moranbacteria bacterium]
MATKKKDILDKLAEEVDKIKEEEVVVSAPKKVKKAAATEEETDLSPMAVLLEENPMKIPQVGDVLEGIVIDITSNSLLLDLGALGTGIVLGKEIKDGLAIGKVKKGDKVGATLIDMENEDGYIELSIREASYERAWDDLEAKRDAMGVVTTKVLDANKGGLMVEVNGITGFVPVSQLSSEHYPRVEDGDKNKILELLKKLVGKEMLVRILDADRASEKLIVSERAASSEKEKEVISQLQAGDTIEGEISGVVDFGAFVKFLPPAKMASDRESDKLEGLVHISELAWQLIDDPRTIVKTGDKVKAKIIGIDDTRISLSMKALAKDPWSEIAEKYKVGDTVQGKIDKINPFGAFVYLDKDIHGLAHVSEFQDVYPGKKMDEILHAGETYDWKILSIEPKDHRMGLMIVKA